MFTIGNRLVAVGAALLLAACSATPKDRLAAAPAADYALSVTNHNWLDVTVFVVQGGTRFHIGNVTGNSTARLRIPHRLVVADAVRLLVDPIASHEYYLTDTILITPEKTVQLTVAPSMRMSSYAIWNR